MNRKYWLFVLIALGLVGVTFANIPNNTVSHNEGAVMPLFNATAEGYWVDTEQVIDDNRNAYFDDLTLTGDLNGYNIMDIGEHRDQPSYILYTDGTTYYAQNGTNYDIEFSGTDGDTVINAAITAAGHGGWVHLTKGVYYINNTITITLHGVKFTGSSMWNGASQFTGTPTNGIYLMDNSDCDIFLVSGLKCKLEDLFLYGNSGHQASGDGIQTGSDTNLDLHVTHVYIGYCKENGVLHKGGSSYYDGVYSEYSGGYGFRVQKGLNWFIGCAAAGNTGAGYYDTNTDETYSNQYVGCESNLNEFGFALQDGAGKMVTNCYIQRNDKHGVWLYGTKNAIISNNILYGNSYEANNAYYQIYLSSLAGDHCVNNTITNNQCFSAETNKPKYSYYESDANQDYNIVKNNVFKDAVTKEVETNGVNDIIRENLGYIGFGDIRLNGADIEMWNSTAWVQISP